MTRRIPRTWATEVRPDKTRALTAEIAADAQRPGGPLHAALADFRRREKAHGRGHAAEVALLIAEYEAAAEWLESMAAAETVEDHVDEFFVDLVLMGLARELRLVLLGLNARAGPADLAACARGSKSCTFG